MDAKELYELSAKYLNGTATAEEKNRLQQWYEEGADKQILITSAYADKAAVEMALYGKIKISMQQEAPVKKMHWMKWAAVTAIILIGSFSYLLIIKNKNKFQQVAHNEAAATHDVKAPDVSRATLTLGDGSIIYLDSAGSGALAVQGNIKVVKTARGELIYKAEPGIKGGKVTYNTILNPRGSKVQPVTLTDGTQLWLNAASSVTYPASFTGNERKVSVTGEAYFEVAKDAARPFRVKFETPSGNESEITVLGTHFNINAYKDEAAAKTTLLEGSIKITCNGGTAILAPAQQACINENKMKICSNVNTEEAVAWKNGFFQFRSASLEQVMRQIARWYDVDISYEGNIPERKFGGKISKESNASEVLRILELSKVKFRIEDKKIIITG